MTTIDTPEPGEQAPPHRARIQWGIAEISAVVAIAGSLMLGLGGIIKIAIAQDRTERTATEAKNLAEKATNDVSSLQGDVREMKTDLRWIRERMERGISR
jgi:hypothetical protein